MSYLVKVFITCYYYYYKYASLCQCFLAFRIFLCISYSMSWIIYELHCYTQFMAAVSVYTPCFLTPNCINEGEKFMQETQHTLQTATRTAQNQDNKTT